ncbi:MAG: RusA family crossover junction endodeoxyribonuclease [Pontiellaceae bacterium]|nr:RusA family crossover junction endodeoxyribonuclease [Pontiellaceae bacterium]MBN2786493.1 RusA family crossover junction endodeoxyribonuclease [Pontiellaceae bacterium]
MSGPALVTRTLAHAFTVLGDPQAQKRHRHVKMGKFVRTYDPSEEEKAHYRVVAQQHAPSEPIREPICVDIALYFSRPKAHFGTGRNACKVKRSAPLLHCKKPDTDNCAKFIMDALSGVFWADDALIYSLRVTKYYSRRPRTEVKVYIGHVV